MMPFILNSLMEFAKKVGAAEFQTPGKRFVLAILSIVGVIAANALMGTEIDPNQISVWITIAFEAFAAFVSAHGSYTLFFKKQEEEAPPINGVIG